MRGVIVCAQIWRRISDGRSEKRGNLVAPWELLKKFVILEGEFLWAVLEEAVAGVEKGLVRVDLALERNCLVGLG